MARSVEEWIGRTDDAKVPPRVRLRIFERFEEKYIPEPNSGCWIWISACTNKGYGHMWVAGRWYEKAHRLSYLLHKGAIPSQQRVCHRCDNPHCVNPDHLWLGTQMQNINDAMAKGRFRNGTSWGENNGSSKLSSDDVKAIRLHPRFYGSGKLLAEKFGVRESTISMIRSQSARRKG